MLLIEQTMRDCTKSVVGELLQANEGGKREFYYPL